MVAIVMVVALITSLAALVATSFRWGVDARQQVPDDIPVHPRDDDRRNWSTRS